MILTESYSSRGQITVADEGRKAVIFLAQTHGATLICTEGRAVFRLEVGIFGKKFNSAAEGRPKFFYTVTTEQ